MIGREEKAEKDKGNGKEGDRKNEAEETKEVATDHQADEDQERVEIEVGAEKFRGEVVAFDRLDQNKDKEQGEELWEARAVEGEEGEREEETGEGAEVGDEVEEAREKAESEGKRDLKKEEASGIENAHGKGDQKLASNIG